MKRLLFSIVSILQFVGMASSCKKCVTCTIYYYAGTLKTPVYQDPQYCGNTQQINAYEKGFKDLQNALPGDSAQVSCTSPK
jgi:hypothetical protein